IENFNKKRAVELSCSAGVCAKLQNNFVTLIAIKVLNFNPNSPHKPNQKYVVDSAKIFKNGSFESKEEILKQFKLKWKKMTKKHAQLNAKKNTSSVQCKNSNAFELTNNKQIVVKNHHTFTVYKLCKTLNSAKNFFVNKKLSFLKTTQRRRLIFFFTNIYALRTF
ncbi:hypothetical protein RFI_39541, partial [Reticulomyxa filosa]